MEDGSGPAKKKKKMATPTTPFGITGLGGLEGLSQMGLGVQEFSELQAKLQKKVILGDRDISNKLNFYFIIYKI